MNFKKSLKKLWKQFASKDAWTKVRQDTLKSLADYEITPETKTKEPPKNEL